jgi:gliding motility-associated-like protein
MIHQTKTKLFKIYMLLVAMVFLQSTYAQTINLNVSVNSLSHVSGAYGSNCGGNDGFLGALGDPDPRIMFRVKHSGTVTYSGEYKTQDPSGLLDGDFYNIACGTFLPILDPILPLPYTQNNVPPTSTINVQLDGYEYDRIDANDGSCGGYGDINGFLATNPVHGQSLSPAITSIPPATSSGIIESYRNGCASDDVTENYGARWSWTWTWTYISLTDDNSGGTVALSTASDAIICVGGDPGLINSTINPLDPIPSTAAIDNIQWEVAQGPLFIYNAIGGANGLTYNPPVLITPGQYKYRRKVTFRTENLLIPDKPIYSNEIQINVVADPNAPTATKVPNLASVCLGTNLTLSTPQYGTNPGKSCGFEYSTSTNGGGTWSAPQATIPTISATGTNNLIRVRVAACTNGCDASNWTNYAWSVISDTAAPTISGNLNVCTGGQTTLTALAPVASTVRWFSDATLTVLVNSGITYTPTINSDTSFWVVQIQGDCQSRATRVNVTALPAPPAPDIIAEDQSICAGQNTNLISVVPTVVWYRDDSRTSRLGVGNIVNTGNLAFTTTFYAADTSGASCPSPLSSITIDVAPAPDVANVLDQIICAGDSTLLSGGTATTEWYSDLALTDTLKIGSTFQTPALSSTKTYYLQVPSSCGNAFDSVTVTVNPIPPAPTASDVEVCSGLSASISLDNTEPGAIVTWYDDVDLENAVQVGSVLITPILTEDKTYYVTQTVLGCTSPASSFDVIIIPSSNPPVLTADPVVVCTGDASTLSSNSSSTIWYSDAGQTRLGTGMSIVVNPTMTTTYYAQDTAIGCSALSSVTVQVSTVLPTPSISDVTVCKGSDVTISGGNSSTVWYESDQTTEVGTGSTLTLTSVQSTATYYARNEGSTCESAFDEFVVNVIELSKPTASGTTICSGQSASLVATGNPNSTLTWYDDAALENAIQVGGLLNTPILTANTTYYVTQTVGSCTSDTTEVSVIVNPSGTPPVLTADPVVVCTGDASTLSSNSSSTIWYSDAGQTRLGTGMSIVVIPTITTTYYAQDTAIGCSALSSVTVQVSTVLPTPSISDVTVCKGSDVTIGGGNSSTVWYELDQTTQLGTGSTLTLTSVQSTATYYARNEGSTCESAFDEFVVNVIELSKPTASGTTICSGQSASLVATGNPNSTLTWYDDAALVNVIQVGGLLNTPILTANTTYYVTQTVGSCTSDTTEVSVIITTPTVAPVLTADPTEVCSGGTSTLTSSAAAGTVWYSDAGITRVGSGATYTTSTLLSTSTFYARDTTNGSCLGSLGAITVNVTSAASAPNIDGTSICSGSTATLTGGNASTVWYSDATLSTIVTTGTSYTTPILSRDTTFYVRNENGDCVSEEVEVLVTVKPKPAKPIASGTTICSGQSASLVATGNPTSTLIWYSDATLANEIQEGGLLNTPILTTNTTYYVTQTLNDCTSDTTQVSVIISSPVATPTLTANPIQVCSGSPTTLTSSAGVKTVWYSDAGITRVGSGATYTTPVLLSTSTFYAKDTTGCSSKLASIVIVVNPLPESPQAITPSPICAGSTATIQGGGVNTVWYSTPNAAVGTNIGAGPSYTTPILNGNTIYYLRNEIGNCKSAITSVTVTVKPKPAKPTVAGTAICAGSSATLNAVSAPQAVTQWYSNSTLTNMVQVGSAYNTPILNLTTSYYVTQTLNGCVSDTAVVTVIVNQKPTIPAVPSQEVCPGETPIFTASNPNNYVIEWYSDPLGTDVWGTGNAFIAPPAQQYTPWYYRPINSITGCKGDVVATWVEVVEARQVVTAEAEPTCVGDPIVVRVANYDFVGDVTIYDYDGNEVGYAEIDIADGVTEVELPAQNSSGYYNYFVIETGEIFCPSFPATFVVQVIDIPTINNISNDTICIGEVAVLTADSKDEIIWYSDVNLTTIVGTGNVLALTGLTETTNYYAVASNGTCKSEPIMATVVVNPLPAKPIVNANSPVCEGATISLSTTTTGNVTYNWTGPNGYTSNVQNPEITPAVKATHQGIYTLTIKDNTTGCTSMAASVQVDINPAPAAPTATNSGPVCEGANAIVSASLVTGAIYSWTGPNGFSSSLQVNNIMNVSLANAGTYSVSIYKDGCWSTAATTTLVVNAKPIIDSVVSNDPVCENQQIIITAYTTAQNINNYNWTVPDGNTINSTSNVLTIDTAEVSDRGMYILTITDANNCKSNPIAEYVDVNKYPDNIIATNNGPKCEGEDIQLNAPNIFGATYSWTGPNQFVSDLRNPTLQDVTVANAGTYTLVVSLGNCSSAPVTTDVVVHANPTANAGLDDTTYQDQPLVLNGSGGSTYQWSNSDYLSTTVTPNPIFIANVVGNYTKTLTVWDDATGCSDDDDVVITVLPKVELSIPDLITPNGDGINDKWVIKYLDNIKESYVINVYARGGALVMTTSSYNQDWTGTYKDKQLPDGAYWYAIELSNGVVYKGTLTIKR